eukprot:2998194-Alexandrium_andersonii.AAC.1
MGAAKPKPMSAGAPVASAGEVAVPKSGVSGAPSAPSQPAATAAKAGEPQDPPGLTVTKTEVAPAPVAVHQPGDPPALREAEPPASAHPAEQAKTEQPRATLL